jgi:hypothetical protein
MSNRVKNTDQTWVVYCHYDNKTPVYIGSGQVHRAFQFIKRSDKHYSWLVENALKNRTADFIKILFSTNDYEEARFVEGRLIAEYRPEFNKSLNKITFNDLSYVIDSVNQGKSIRSCAKEIGIYHNNLCQLLKLKYCKNNYEKVMVNL